MRNGSPAAFWPPEELLPPTLPLPVLAAAEGLSRYLTRATPGRPRPPAGRDGLFCESLHCRTGDGLRLAGWVITPPRPRGTVALFHDVRGNRETLLPRLNLLAAAGYRCVAFDHRAHGESDGRRTTFGWHEARDVAAVLDVVEARWPRQPCAAVGVGLGAAALCLAGPRLRSLRAVVLEALYADLETALLARPTGPGQPPWLRGLARLALGITERRLGFRLGEAAPLFHVGGLAPVPVLLLGGAKDAHAPPAAQRRLFEQCGRPRELVILPRVGRHDLVERGGDLYRAALLGFFQRWLTPAAARAA